MILSDFKSYLVIVTKQITHVTGIADIAYIIKIPYINHITHITSINHMVKLIFQIKELIKHFFFIYIHFCLLDTIRKTKKGFKKRHLKKNQNLIRFFRFINNHRTVEFTHWKYQRQFIFSLQSSIKLLLLLLLLSLLLLLLLLLSLSLLLSTKWFFKGISTLLNCK